MTETIGSRDDPAGGRARTGRGTSSSDSTESPDWTDSVAARDAIAARAIELAERWTAEAADKPASRSARLLADVLADESGLAFTVGFVDRVVRPEDLGVAARNLAALTRPAPRFLPLWMRTALRLGGALAPALPWLVVPIARRVFRGMVGHLVADARPARLGRAIARLRRRGVRLNLNLLGEAVLGEREADRRLDGTRRLLERDDVDYVSIKVSAIATRLNMWAFGDTVDRVVERLVPLYEFAATSPTRKFINLDMEEYRDLDLTIAVFERLLDRPSLRGLEAGIVLQTYLPDAVAALDRLTAFAIRRSAAGGAGIKVRIVKGANLAMERVDAAIHGWPLATFGSKVDTDANFIRTLERALRPERTRAVRIGVASHNLFDIAFARELAAERGVSDRVDFEMLLGMAEGQAQLVERDTGGLLLYVPVVQPAEFDVAISYLVRRLEENASSDNFMSAIFDLDDERMFARERDRFLESIARADGREPDPNRVQNRATESALARPAFANESDTDPALAANREWATRIIERARSSRLGAELVAASAVGDAAGVDAVVRSAAAASDRWRALAGAGRARVLRDAAAALASRRADLLEVMASEAGKTIGEGDPEVSEAIDFANYYARLAEELDAIDGARFEPARVTVVTPPWNFPVAIPAGSVLAALAAGSAVVLKPAPQSRRCAAVLAETLWSAGVPRDVLHFVDVAEGDLGRRLITHGAVDRVVLTGSIETAALFRSWRPDLPLLAETSGKNAIIVTPSADLDLAVADVARSAFGHAGQKCSAASLVILVGSVARSDRFRRQLVDAVSALRVGDATDARTTMGPLIEPAHGKLLEAFTTLGPGERWLVDPRRLDDEGRVWTPGIRDGVRPGSAFHRTEYFGPVLGIMRAATLDEAIDLQNATDFGLTAGLHSLDPRELEHWLDRVEAGNLYVNRGITGAIVERQPFGGWKRSSVGPGAKAGGPNYLLSFGAWEPAPFASEPATGAESEADSKARAGARGDRNAGSNGPDSDVARVLDALDGTDADAAERARLRAAALDDERQWSERFGIAVDASDVGVERNLFRYRPADVALRLGERATPGDAVRVLLAAIRAGAGVEFSVAPELARSIGPVLDALPSRIRVSREPNAQWAARIVAASPRPFRIRLVGESSAELAAALDGDPSVAILDQPVTNSGRLELLPFLREQAVSVTAHRFGNPNPWSEQVL